MGLFDRLFGSSESPAPPPSTGSGAFVVVLEDAGDRKIATIKALRAATGFDLRDAKALADMGGVVLATDDGDAARRVVKSLIVAGASARLDQAGAPPQTPSVSGSRAVQLVSFDHLIAAIKAVREVTGLGLAESKALVDSAPVNVVEGCTDEAALKVLMALTEAGCQAEIL